MVDCPIQLTFLIGFVYSYIIQASNIKTSQVLIIWSHCLSLILVANLKAKVSNFGAIQTKLFKMNWRRVIILYPVYAMSRSLQMERSSEQIQEPEGK